ncbi:hypothetical protein ACFQHV_23745 [Promicromonospora thailandica]|uniref:hypothetical protein n=1 Tax=Promicromonospora thailandica TaxID=765201 RepID=UPI0020A262FC|nr:hypothetical protein [Promicromonospora thailandica]
MSWYSWSDGEQISVTDLARSAADGSPLVGHVTIALPDGYPRPTADDDVLTTHDGDVVYAVGDTVVRLGADGAIVWSHDLGAPGSQVGLARSGSAALAGSRGEVRR